MERVEGKGLEIAWLGVNIRGSFEIRLGALVLTFDEVKSVVLVPWLTEDRSLG